MATVNAFGFSTYMICEEGFENVVENGVATGFRLQLRLANYKGYILSQIEDIRIAVDGEWVSREHIAFTLEGRTYTLDEMESAIDDRWEISQTATVFCAKPGGLSLGEHELEVEEVLRPTYMPVLAISHATKTLNLVS
jgi:hypothetical protein